MHRVGQTARFVYRTYRRVQGIKLQKLTPRVAGDALARDCCTMGPLYVKLAQFISARKDVVDPEFAEALSVVQDSLPVTDIDPPRLKGYVFDEVPIASASIADVFRGTRQKDGRAVVAKKRRPGVKERIFADLPILMAVMLVASAVHVPGARNVYEMIQESRPMLTRELDFRQEAASATEFSMLFKEVPWIRVPRVIDASEEVMVSEFVKARRLADVKRPNPALAQRLMDLYMMMLERGLVHADPHPGNLGFLPDGDIVLYDFGAVLRVTTALRNQVAKLLSAGLAKDADTIVSSLEELGVLTVRPGQRTSVRRVLRKALNGNIHEELQNTAEFTAASNDTRVVRFGSTFVYLTRTLSLIEGACKELDPEFRYDYEQWIDAAGFLEGLTGMVRDAASMPATMQTMQNDLEEFQMRIIQEIDQGKQGLYRTLLTTGACLIFYVILLR